MTTPNDKWSAVVNRALDVIFAKYPARTGLGVMFGSALSTLAQLFAPTLRQLTALAFDSLGWWNWIPIGILIMHGQTIRTLFQQKPIGNDLIDQALDLLERANFSADEKRQQYRLLIERVTKELALTKQTEAEVKNTENKIASQDPHSRA